MKPQTENEARDLVNRIIKSGMFSKLVAPAAEASPSGELLDRFIHNYICSTKYDKDTVLFLHKVLNLKPKTKNKE